MTDLRRIVRRPPSGTVVVLDVDDQTNYVMVRDSFTVTPPTSRPILAARQRRFGGARTVGEIHDNGTIAWTALVMGSSPAACLELVEALLTATESAASGLFFEWKPQSAAQSVFYDIRGPATWKPNYSAMQMEGAYSMLIDVTIPVAPGAQLAQQTMTISSRDWPARAQLPSPIPGNMPAIVDVDVHAPTNNRAPWVVIGWVPRPTTPIGGTLVPCGVLQGELGVEPRNAQTVVTGSSYFGGSAVQLPSDTILTWQIDPSTLAPDDFAQDEVDVEIYARVKIPPALVGSRLALSMVSSQIGAAGTDRYTAEFGERGALITDGHTLGNMRTYRLGTLTMPINKDNPSAWTLAVTHSCDSGSGNLVYDYLFAVPIRSRAVAPTGVELSSVSPFIPTNSAAVRTVLGADLSGLVTGSAGIPVRSSSLGGSPIEMAPGDVDFLMLLSTGIPDGPTSDEGPFDDSVSRTVSVGIVVTPRVWLTKGT